VRLLLVDNYDSFTWNLAHYLEQLDAAVDVILNDRITVEEALAADYDGWVISPGPGLPRESGVTPALVRAADGRLPLLGVCLGHQAIAEAHGARLIPAPTLMHGKVSPIRHDGRGIFRDLPREFEATRYHSWVVDEPSLSAPLEVSARTAEGVVMALRHKQHLTCGMQFHPESIMTGMGMKLLGNFVAQIRGSGRSSKSNA